MKNYTNFHKSTYIHTHLLQVTYRNLHKPTSTVRKSKKQTSTWTEALQDGAPDLHHATLAAAQLLQLLRKVGISRGWWQPLFTIDY